MKFWIAVLCLVAAPAQAYWVHKTASLKGRHEIVVRDSVRYLYLRVSPKHPARWKLKRSKSVRFRFENLSRKGPARVRLLRNGKTLKTWRVKHRREVKIHLPRGSYWLVSTRPVRLRYYEWRRPNLRRVVPLTGGLPATLAVKDKHTTYYWVTPEGPVTFRVRGPARVWFYFRALQGKPVVFRVLEGDSVVFRLKNHWQPSQKARILEDSTLRVTRPRKRFLKVPAGVHRYRVEVEGGRGLVKLYREVPKIRKRRSRKPSPRERLLGAPRGSAWVPLFLTALPQKPRHRLSLQAQLAYLSNPFTFAAEDLDRLRQGTAPYRYPGVERPNDLRLRIRGRWQWKARRYRLETDFTAYGYLWNRAKNRWSLALTASYRLRPYTWAGFALRWRPGVYVRPVYRRSVQQTHPLVYSALGTEAWGRKPWQSLRWTLAAGWSHLAYQPPFAYVSGHRWYLRVEARRSFWSLGGRLGVYRTTARPWEPDASYLFLAPRLEIGRALRLTASFTWKRYLTADSSDALHYGRHDRETRLRLSAPAFRLGSGTWLRVLVAYAGRRTDTRTSGQALVFKNYDAWTVGLVGFWSVPLR